MLPATLAEASGAPQITVMTENTYVGTGLTDVFAASSWSQLVAAASRAGDGVLANDVRTRARALADEIVWVRPEVVGLQEASLWRGQTHSDVGAHPAPNGTNVVFDLLAILRGGSAPAVSRTSRWPRR